MKLPYRIGLTASVLALASSLAAGTASAATAAPVKAGAATATGAAAPAFNAAGTWTLNQSNGYTVTLTLTQDSAGNLYGYAASAPDGLSGRIEDGSMVNGTSIVFVIGWSSGIWGKYTGSLNADRTLSGNTEAIQHPWVQATWNTFQTF